MCPDTPVDDQRSRPATVVHLSSGHYADDARIYWKECRSLALAGYKVAFVVQGARRSRLAGALLDNVEVIKVQGRSSRVGRLVLLPFSILAAGLRRNGDVYHFHDPELLLIGFMLRLLGKQVIYDAHEDVPRDIQIKPWVPRPLRGIVARGAAAVEWLAGRTLSGIVAATPVIAGRFPRNRTALVQNFARPEEFQPTRTALIQTPRVVAYVGGITAERCAVEMVRAMDKVTAVPRPCLAMAGGISSPELMAELVALPGWSHVDYRGHLDRDGVRSTLAQASIGLALFHPVQSYIDSQPVKLFEYMAAGIPVVASDFPRFRSIIETHGCGLCVPSMDVGAIAAAIDRLLADPGEARAMGERGRALMVKSYSWASEEAALLSFYRGIACRTSRAAI